MWDTQPAFTADQLRSIKVPTVIADGEYDEAILPKHIRYMASSIPGARQFLGAARADGDLRSHFAQGRGDLQAETARAAGDERDLIPKLE